MSRGALLLGTAKIDITPARPIPLAGFGNRSGPYLGVNRRLFARVNVFEQESGGSTRRLLIAQGDIIWWGSERMERIRSELGSRFGIGPADVILSAQHTHGGPQTSTLFCDVLGLPDEDYLRELDEALLRGVEQAVARLEPVTVWRGKGECVVGVNRRKLVGGRMTMAPNPEGPLDPDVNVVRFRKEDGSTKAVFLHYACHPTTTNSNYVTSEYPGVAAERLEATIGCGAVVSFLQGCTGNVRPALHRDGKFYSGTEEDVARLGRTLADEVERVLAGPMEEIAPALEAGRRAVAQLPFQELPTKERLEASVAEGGVSAQWGRKLLGDPNRLRPSIPLELTLLRLSGDLSFLAMDGEIVLEYGEYIKRRTGGRTLPMGYSNGMIGYVPTAAQIEEGGYEGKDSGVYFALPAAFAPEIENVIKSAIDELIGKEE
ncbi:neutral/alkaline non-lysosomal ceramidase N-terminal domain-containing protein [Paenibacillus sp. GYB003]|uniref:neutral/alkaline non-lysosomal ceramidase N-terminal domain-containing protein n=1 Tax=Paenibacillus sp. GYB003 TaxID=2994392 RepID=UPI002F96577F